jgi:hypothetical protein
MGTSRIVKRKRRIKMGMRYIVVPPSFQLTNPETGEAVRDEKTNEPERPSTFQAWCGKLMFNPMWAESYSNVRAADAIYEALASAVDGVVVLAEEDWLKLKAAAEFPKMASGVAGFGYHPVFARQFLPFFKAIMEAKDVKPQVALKAVE